MADEQTPQESPVELSVDDMDALLKQEDPEFENSMKELGSIQVEGANLEDESIDLENTILDEAAPIEAEPEAARKPVREWFKRQRLRLRNAKRAVHYKIFEIRQGGWSSLKKMGLSLWRFLKALGRYALDTLQEIFFHLRLMSWRERLIVVLALGLCGAAIQVVRFALSGRELQLIRDRYITDLAGVADEVMTFDEESPFLDFYASSHQPQFFVALDKFVVNLLASENSGPQPMGAFKFFIEGSSEEVAIEIKDREKEIRDLIQRSMEQMSYDQLVTPDGKQRAKILLRKTVNEILSAGRIRRILIDTFVLKP